VKSDSSNIIGIVLVTVVVGLIVSLITGVNFWEVSPTPNTNPLTELALNIPPKKDAEFQVAGWVPDWASESGLNSISANAQQLTNISPVWYEAQEDGTLKNNKPRQANDIINQSATNGIEVTPSIALFSHEILTSIFADPNKLQTHIDAIITAGSEDGVDGIDIDYESTKLSDKEGYFALLKGVYDGLQAKDKRTIVTVLPKWGDNIRYLSLVETRQVQDWTRIAQYADEIRVMAYDYTWQSAPLSGPIAPLSWHEQIIQYGLTQVPADKLVLAIHLYSYEKFIEKDEPGAYRTDLLQFTVDWKANKGEPNRSRAYTYETIQKIYRENTILSDESVEGERVIRYSKLNEDTGKFEDRITVYIDPEGVQQRVDLAKKYNLGGVAFWRLGGEGDLLQGIDISE
jgi:spore germination protein YaaH